MNLNPEHSLSDFITDLYQYPDEITVDLENCRSENVWLRLPNDYIISIGIGEHHYGNNRYDMEYGQEPDFFTLLSDFSNALSPDSTEPAIKRAQLIKTAREFEVGVLNPDDGILIALDGWDDTVKGWVDVPELIEIIETVQKLP